MCTAGQIAGNILLMTAVFAGLLAVIAAIIAGAIYLTGALDLPREAAPGIAFAAMVIIPAAAVKLAHTRHQRDIRARLSHHTDEPPAN